MKEQTPFRMRESRLRWSERLVAPDPVTLFVRVQENEREGSEKQFFVVESRVWGGPGFTWAGRERNQTACFLLPPGFKVCGRGSGFCGQQVS